MVMYNPPHPGEFIDSVYLEPNGVTVRGLAHNLDVTASTVSRLVNGSSRVTPEMALRLSRALGRSAESWLQMQEAHDLWQARERSDLSGVTPLDVSTA